MKKNPVSKAIKEAKFLKALVDSTGNAKEAYKAIQPHVTDLSAGVLGSRALDQVSGKDIDALYEKIGCTKHAVITELWERMKNGNVGFAEGTRILTKIGAWDKNNSGFAELLSRDLDLIEVVKIRLKKRSSTNDLGNIIDVDNTLVNSKSNDTATENSNSDEQLKQ